MIYITAIELDFQNNWDDVKFELFFLRNKYFYRFLFLKVEMTNWSVCDVYDLLARDAYNKIYLFNFMIIFSSVIPNNQIMKKG